MTEPTIRTSHRMQQLKEDRQRENRRWKLIGRGVLLLAVLATVALVVVHYWPDPREARLETVAETDSPSWLARIAVEHRSEQVARAAVEKLDDPALLEQIAMSQTSLAAVRAVLKLTQPDSLARVALNSPRPDTRYIAILQITDQGVLETIALQDSPMSRVAALRLTDKQIARKVFNHTDNWKTKLAAARGVDDPELLMVVAHAVNTTNGENYTAVKLLAPHQAELEQVANQATDLYVRKTAIKLLTDPIARARIVLRGKDYWRGSHRLDRRALIRTLNDPTALAMVVNAKHISSSDRCSAVERLTDQPTLVEIARSNFDPKAREAATRRVTDPAVLRQLVKTKQGIQQRIAIGKSADVEFLKTLLGDGSGVDEVAGKRLEQLTLENDDTAWIKEFEKKHPGTDQQLARIALASNYNTDAVKKITAPDVIKQVALADNRRNRIAAIERLDDQKSLKRIAKNQYNPWDVRKAAMKRITDQDWLMELFIWRDPAITTGYGFASMAQKLAVVYCLMDQKHLMAIAIDPRCGKGGDSDHLAWSAAHRVTDPALAQRVLLESPYRSAKFWGAKYTTDPEALVRAGWKHLHGNGSWELCREIAPKLEDRTLLLRMASYLSASIGPNAAELRLADLDRTLQCVRHFLVARRNRILYSDLSQ